MKLSIIIPVYNEEQTISEVIERVWMVDLGDLEREVIIVNDGSSDGTRRAIDTSRWINDPRVTTYNSPINLGKGAAVRMGLGFATGDILLVQDADLELDPNEYTLLIAPLLEGRADVVYGSRFLGTHRVFLLTHYLGNRLLTFITNVLYNTMLTDMETCYKVMRADVLRSIELKSNGFGIEPEITAKVFKRRYKVYEVPISYDGRGYDEGKKITWRDGVVALWVLLKYRFME